MAQKNVKSNNLHITQKVKIKSQYQRVSPFSSIGSQQKSRNKTIGCLGKDVTEESWLSWVVLSHVSIISDNSAIHDEC